MKRKCKICKDAAIHVTPLYSYAHCGKIECITAVGQLIKDRDRANWQKKYNQETKRMKKKLTDNDKSFWTKKAQSEFNKYIRERDKNEPCISCGLPPGDRSKLKGGYWHAGHYRSTGAFPELRFEPLNCHKQCPSCNNYKSGNIIEYRIRLCKKIGQENLDWIEGQHIPKRYRVDDLKDIYEKYKKLNKGLKDE